MSIATLRGGFDYGVNLHHPPPTSSTSTTLRRRSVEPAARHFDAAVALDPAGASDERGGEPARQPHNDGREDRGPQPGEREPRHEPGHQGDRNPVHDQDEEPQGEDRERQSEDEDDRANHGVHDTEEQRRDYEIAPTVEMHAGDDGLRRPQPEPRDHEAEEEPFHALKILARLAPRPAGHEPGRHSGAYLHAQLRVEQDRTDEGIAHSRRADPGERSQVHRPAIDQRLLRGAVPGDGERFGARHREYQGALEAARAAYRDAHAIEDHIGELEAVAQLGQREGVAARHHPVVDVRLREARAQVHLRRATRVRRPARGKRGEQRDAHPEGVRTHGETLSVARIRALVESAARIALPTPLAPGIRDFARIESRWRSVSESRSAADLAVLPPEHAASSANTKKGTKRVMMVILASPRDRGYVPFSRRISTP